MNKSIIIILFILVARTFSQTISFEERKGKVSFITSQNIYVRFESTIGINKNDTLYYMQGGKILPAIVVQYVSSNSCSGLAVTSYQLKVDDELLSRIKVEQKTEPLKNDSTEIETVTVDENSAEIISIKKASPLFRRSSGNISVSSYSNKSNSPGSADFQNWRYNFSFEGDSIASSPISFSTYINFSYRADRWNEITNNLGQAIKVYDLAIEYDISEATKITLGRKINYKTSSLGAIDGVQFETSLKKFVVGALAGSHPSFSDYGFDIKMFEFGGYVFRSDTLGSVPMQNTIGVFEQTNNFKTDRRFLYFQHNNSITQSLGFFFSSEFDLYKRKSGVEQNVFNLTSLFAMGSYNPANWIGLSASYDARKNVIYYETFRTYADSILESATRQGLSMRLNLRPLNYLWFGANYGYRFSKDDPRPSSNYGLTLNYLQIPSIYAGLSINYNRIESGYVNGNYYGASLNKDFFNGELNFDIGYKIVDYEFTSGRFSFLQKIGNFDLSWRVRPSLFLTASYEGTFQDKTTYGRLYISVSQRF